PGPMITTFHGWFFHLLARAPLALRAPGEIIEDAALLREEAWHAFVERLGRERGGPLESAFAALAAELPLASLRQLLDGLLARRAEWWAAGLGREDAVVVACAELQRMLGVSEDEDVLGGLYAAPGFVAESREYCALLAENGARGLKTDAQRALELERALRGIEAIPLTPALSREREREKSEGLARLRSVFLTQTNTVRAARAGGEQERRLGADGAARYLELHQRLGEQVLRAIERLAEQRALRLNRLGLLAGAAYLQAYAEAKAARGGLDFADAELETARLLDDDAAAAAVLMKLDCRWKHVLLDEFQDTNPLQWRILRAWLEAYGEDGARPTVFMVGDPKQSIYRFRRAEPRLFAAAADWLRARYGAAHYPHDETRRCAPRVVAWVNALFAERADYAGFRPHGAHQAGLPGRCELYAAPAEAAAAAAIPFRNPLRDPPPVRPHKRAAEAAWVAARIGEVVGRLRVRAGDAERPARHADILLLYASRADLEVFEDALRRAGIPYLGDRRGGLLDTLEARDLAALLEVLVSPLDDLALAHALRSPLFGLGNEDLRRLAGGEGPWWARLREWAAAADAPPRVTRAVRLLADWRRQVGRLPVHDLLDRIYHQADVPARYATAVPAHLRAGVLANLEGLLNLALSLSGGRYPSLPRFLDELRQLRERAGQDAPDEPPAAAGDAVRLLTIHGAKGLEAPVVFLVKADQGTGHDDACGVLIDWPPESDRPAHFSLHGAAAWRGPGRDALFERERQQAARERLNLLYVAMTRARQALFVSGVEDGKPGSWLGLAREALQSADMAGLPEMVWPASSPLPQELPGGIEESETGGLQRGEGTSIGTRIEPTGPEAELGIQVHAWLQGISQGVDAVTLRARLDLEAARAAEVAALAGRILAIPELAPAFDPTRHLRAHNELEFLDPDGRVARIDRLVEFAAEVWVLDYKTGDLEEPDLARRAAPHLAQMAAYGAAARALFPDKPVRLALAFADGRAHWLVADGDIGDHVASFSAVPP
ncbi:MAG: UvrD-helicase domain-containing protein, partial [Thiobacillaceae bacterium]|nr:UvrD-helicase domain-containing protein [Thiobacillaceae bacterium]